MSNKNVFQSLGQEELYYTTGGYEEDREFGYKIGVAIGTIMNAVDDAVDWVSSLCK